MSTRVGTQKVDAIADVDVSFTKEGDVIVMVREYKITRAGREILVKTERKELMANPELPLTKADLLTNLQQQRTRVEQRAQTDLANIDAQIADVEALP